MVAAPFGKPHYEAWRKEADKANVLAEQFLEELDTALAENGCTQEQYDEAIRQAKNMMAWQETPEPEWMSPYE